MQLLCIPLIWGAIAMAVVSAYSAYRARQQSQSFAERMSGSAHQREVRDLRLAGLNPILSAGGRGATTPNVPPARYEQAAQLGLAHSALQIQKTGITAKANLDNASAQSIRELTHKREFQGKLYGNLNKIVEKYGPDVLKFFGSGPSSAKRSQEAQREWEGKPNWKKNQKKRLPDWILKNPGKIKEVKPKKKREKIRR